jgi:hypothetical protein
MPTRPPTKKSAHISLSLGLSSTPSKTLSRDERQRQANQAAELIKENSPSTTSPNMTAAIDATAAAAVLAAATAANQAPVSLHEGAIIETTRVGIALRDQAEAQLTLDTKFDAKPKNLKGFLRKLTDNGLLLGDPQDPHFSNCRRNRHVAPRRLLQDLNHHH